MTPQHVLIFFGLIIFFCLGYLWGAMGSRNREQQKAIDRKVGRYTIDPETGETDFEYGHEK